MAKHQYCADDIVYSDGWCIDDYRTADKVRQQERQAVKDNKNLAVADVLQIIEDETICSFSYLVRFIAKHHPEYSSIVLDKSPFFGRYVDSKRYDRSVGFTEYCYKDVCNMLDAERQQYADLDERYEERGQVLDEKCKELAKYKHLYNELNKKYYDLCQLFVENSEENGFVQLNIYDD